MDIRKLDWKEIGVERVYKDKIPAHPGRDARKRLTLNMNNYTDWVFKTLQEITGHELQGRERFNALAIYMNEKNVEDFLRHSLDGMNWLYIAPSIMEPLDDDEYAISIKEAVVCPF